MCEIEQVVSTKLVELKENIILPSPSKGSINEQLLNGSSNQRLFQRVAQIDQTLAILLVIQLLLFHCYVPTPPYSSKPTSKINSSPPDSYEEEKSLDLSAVYF